ncbi:hypothetical protein [Streptomyces sp. NBC_00467]|uniref:hypothetical protein n=1 Tax=Streptomyces sp. NBC_00467 TaxID=2975752 RepID=UPI002E1795FF
MNARRRQLNWPTLAEVMEEREMLGNFGIGVFNSPRLDTKQRRPNSLSSANTCGAMRTSS